MLTLNIRDFKTILNGCFGIPKYDVYDAQIKNVANQ